MRTKCYSANGPGSPSEETIMNVLNKNTVFRHVLLKDGSCLEIHPILSLHVEVAPAIFVNMPMQIPSNARKRNATSKELSTTEEAVAIIHKPEDILLKPTDIVSKN